MVSLAQKREEGEGRTKIKMQTHQRRTSYVVVGFVTLLREAI